MIINQLVVPVLQIFEGLKDEELITLIRGGDIRAEEFLILRYSSYVRSIARSYFLAGGDAEDLIQEGMIGVIKAIAEFDAARHVSFKTFAVYCIRNRIYSAIRNSMRGKHSPLNNYVSMASCENIGIYVENVAFTSDIALDPVEKVINEETCNELLKAVSELLSKFERNVLELYLEGLSYAEISEKLSKPQKSVDNAVQRIRRKIAQYLEKQGDNG